MNPQFSLFDLLLILGIIQGIITSILLFKSKKNRQSNRFLALGLLSFCLLSTKPLLHTQSLWETQYFGYFPNALELAVAPLLFFYVKALFTPDFQFKKKYYWHFVPFFISQTYSFIVYFSVFQIEESSIRQSIANSLFFDEVKQLDEYILLLATIVYLYRIFKSLKNYKNWLDDTTSDTQLPNFKWLKDLLYLLVFIGLLLLIGRVLQILSLFKTYNVSWFSGYFWKFLNLYIAFLIYYLGLRAYLQPHYSFPKNEAKTKKTIATPNPQNAEKYQEIERVMKEDKVFLNTQLNLQELANHLNLPQREVSQIINQYFQMNFRDFINHYRVEEVKSKLNDSDYSNMSILGIATECGFSSETSFYRLFKKHVGMTPKKFLEQENSL